MKLRFLLPVFLFCLACNKVAEIPPLPAAAYLMFYNGAPEFYGIESLVLINNRFNESLGYNNNGRGLVGAYNASQYQLTDTGLFRITFTDSTGKTGKITEGNYQFSNKKHYTLYLADSLGYYETLVTNDDVEPDPQMAKIRIIHLSPDAGSISVQLDTIYVKGLAALNFREVSDYVSVVPDVKPAIRILENGVSVPIVRKSFPLDAGKCYTMILRGYKKPPDNNVNKTVNLSTIINF
jgi:hypothetical protein